MTEPSDGTFDIAFLGAGRVVHHRLIEGRLIWSIPDTAQIYSDACITERLYGVEIIRFSKRAASRPDAHTYLVLDRVAGHAFDATFVKDAEPCWHFDRGRIGKRIHPATALAFPRVFDDHTPDDVRVFRLPKGLLLQTRSTEPGIELRGDDGFTAHFLPLTH